MRFRGIDRKKRLSLVAQLQERDGNKCFYCGLPMNYPTLEHLYNTSDGGSDDQDNLVLTHMACNQYVGNLGMVSKIKLKTTLDSSVKARESFLKRVVEKGDPVFRNVANQSLDFVSLRDFAGVK